MDLSLTLAYNELRGIKKDGWLDKPIKDWPSSDSKIVNIWIEESRHV